MTLYESWTERSGLLQQDQDDLLIIMTYVSPKYRLKYEYVMYPITSYQGSWSFRLAVSCY